jgi:hypothetical protein
MRGSTRPKAVIDYEADPSYNVCSWERGVLGMAKSPLRLLHGKGATARPFKSTKVIPIVPSRQITDPRELYVPPPGKGSVVLSTRVEPEIGQQIEHIVQGGQTAFSTKNDYLRAAVCYFHENIVAPLLRDKLLVKDIHFTSAKIRMARMTTRLRDYDTFINAYKDALMKLAKLDCREEVAEMWVDARRTAKRGGDEFYRIVVKWMESDPALRRVREIVREEKANR